MKKGGLLSAYKLYYEELHSTPKFTSKKGKKNTKAKYMDNHLRTGFTYLVPAIFQSLKISSKTNLVTLNDRKTMQKLPQANKAKAKKAQK